MVLNETQTAIQDSIRDFAQNEIRPHSAAYEQAKGYPPELFVRLAEMGLFGLTAPEEFGGAAADYVSYALALIELGAADYVWLSPNGGSKNRIPWNNGTNELWLWFRAHFDTVGPDSSSTGQVYQRVGYVPPAGG